MLNRNLVQNHKYTSRHPYRMHSKTLFERSSASCLRLNFRKWHETDPIPFSSQESLEPGASRNVSQAGYLRYWDANVSNYRLLQHPLSAYAFGCIVGVVWHTINWWKHIKETILSFSPLFTRTNSIIRWPDFAT